MIDGFVVELGADTMGPLVGIDSASLLVVAVLGTRGFFRHHFG